MNAKTFKNQLLALEEKLESEPQPTRPQSARSLYFELQRLVHQYEGNKVTTDAKRAS